MFYPIEKAKGLNDLKDTSIVTPKNNDIVLFDGDEWVNSDVLKEQEVVPSDNLFVPTLESQATHGITMVKNGGVYSFSGTSDLNSVWTLEFGSYTIPADGDYKIVGCDANGGYGSAYWIGITKNNVGAGYDEGQGKIITCSKGDVIRLNACFYNLYAITGTVYFKPMITKNLNATYADYEPYYLPVKDAMWTKEQQRKNGAYNLCSNEKLTTQVLNGITITFNPTGYPKGCVKLDTGSGTATTGTWIPVNYKTMELVTGQTYRMVGVENGAVSTYRLHYSDGVTTEAIYDGGVNFVCGDASNTQVNIYVSSGASLSNVIVKPMITTDLNATYDDYVPHAKTNRELTEDVEGHTGISAYITPVTSGNNIDTNSIFVEALGKLRIVHIAVKFSANATGIITIATAKSSSLPSNDLTMFLELSGSTSKAAYIDASGNIKLDNPIAGWHYGTLTYLAK